MEAYLDNSATTPPCAESIAATQDALTRYWGNPSSLHQAGIEAEHLLSSCRSSVASAIGCEADEVFFTSGGTESNNLAIVGAALANRRRGKRIVTSAVEHSSVMESTKALQERGFEVVYLSVDRMGRVSEQELARAINRDTILVSLMAANNEVGTVQPIDVVRRIVTRVGAPATIHCDAVQAFGKLRVQPARLGVDLLTVSSHKIHGPKGVGALYVRKGVKLNPLLYGGSQESKLRPGTEAMPVIAGFAAAANALPPVSQSLAYVTGVRDRLLDGLRGMEDVRLNSPQDALPYIVNISVYGIPSETMLNFLSQRGICVSSGSACAKGKQSRVLRAMGLGDSEITSALRVSFSRFTTWEEIDTLLHALNEARQTLVRSK
ncbi:MAG: cysteine desulfurase [Oscillospiraceae bacterium]|jgi:cysteine desulfurase|nr:cysteine desulfurase [Oscillospiraceae bacterium]